MHVGLESLTVLAILVLMATPAIGVRPTQDEMKTAKQWVTEHFKPAKGTAGQPPFSFVYGGRPSDELLDGWTFSQTRKKLDAKPYILPLSFMPRHAQTSRGHLVLLPVF